MTMLYKYRSLNNWEFILDIFLNDRLFAAPFRTLNDPMEGRYYYRDDEVSKTLLRRFSEEKDYWKICSLSRDPRNTLMWSYYAGGHAGAAIGLDVVLRKGQKIENVNYDNEIYVDAKTLKSSPRNLALKVLRQKQESWSHEKEVRIFSRVDYVSVKIQEIFLGCNISDRHLGLIKGLMKHTHPRIRVKKLNRHELNRPLELKEGRAPTV